MAVALTWPQSNTRTIQPFQLQNGTGTTATNVDLTGFSSISLALAKQGLPITSYAALTGTPTVTGLTTGQFTWKFSAADVAVPGVYNLVITVLYTNGDVWTNPPVSFTIQETK